MKFLWEPRVPVRLRYMNSVFFMNLFVLLLFFAFILPSLMRPSGLAVALPHVIASEAIEMENAVVVIRQDNTIYLDNRRVAPEELKATLLRRMKAEFQVLIKADEQARIATLAQVWDVCRQAGAAKVSIATNEDRVRF